MGHELEQLSRRRAELRIHFLPQVEKLHSKFPAFYPSRRYSGKAANKNQVVSSRKSSTNVSNWSCEHVYTSMAYLDHRFSELLLVHLQNHATDFLIRHTEGAEKDSYTDTNEQKTAHTNQKMVETKGNRKKIKICQSI